MHPIGRKRWAIAEGYIPSQSAFSGRALISHDYRVHSQRGRTGAKAAIMIYFADREPVGP